MPEFETPVDHYEIITSFIAMVDTKGTRHDPFEWLRAKAAEAEKAKTAKLIQLPIWPEPVRGVPNSILRSALFGVVRRGKRRYMEHEQIASVDGIRLFYTGQRLDQADLDVWEQCLHLARTSPLGAKVYFTAYAFLRAIGRDTGKSQHEWLKATLRRLMGAIVEIEDGRKAYAGQLIHHWYRDEETLQHVIEINPKIAVLYGSNGWTAVEWEKRMAMRRQQLAQWLHGFYSSHAEPYPLRVETLRQLCGSETKELYHFRIELREALTVLEQATGWQWHIDENDLVHVKKTPTPSQSRHLIRNKKKLR